MPWKKEEVPDKKETLEIDPFSQDILERRELPPERIWDEHSRKYPKGNHAPPKLPPDPENFYDPAASKHGRIRQRSL